MINENVKSELSLSHGSAVKDPCTINGHPLIQCSYLETFIFDGRCEHLVKYNFTPVLDARDGTLRYEMIKPSINSELVYNLFIKIFSFIALFVEIFALCAETLSFQD